MKQCPVCNEEFDEQRVFCPRDGATLVADAARDPLVGRVLDGKYRLEARLGRGGMGDVYRARHMLIGDLVAIKVLRRDLIESSDAVERLRREARAARHLRNPHAIHVIDFSATEDGIVYLVMEYVEGQSLRDLLARERTLSPARAAAIVAQIAPALDEAHQHGIVHRDLKPDNVMIERGGDGGDFVRVLDFGIAKFDGGDTRGGALTSEDVILGTPYYLSPEQCGAGPVGPWSDVYSLGVLLYELTTGAVPFDGRTPMEIASRHLFSTPRPPRELAPDLSEEAQAVILKAMAKDPRDRYASAGELASAFAVAVGAGASRLETADVASGPLRGPAPPTARVAHRITEPDPIARTTHGAELAVPSRSRRAWFAVAAVALVIGAFALWLMVSGPRGARSPAPAAEMVFVPAGEFLMGSDTTRRECQDEHPPHSVFVPAFYIDRTEVTNTQFRAFCDATGRPYPPGPGWDPNYFLEKPDYPVINVTWKEAGDYAKWAGKRLPTEAEWERAARGDDERTYPWGNEVRPGVVTVDGTSDGYANTAPVGSFPEGAGPYGCVDLIGNVFEWTADWYDAYPGSDGSWDEKGDTGFKKRVIRGGAYTGRIDAPDGIARASERFCEKPEYRSENLGFRCAKTP
jgi:formylglycine-generating enzyme required for sulfatase activity/tRNA A-37 threonylcarbamoyl transferase component Bud32